MTTGGEVRAVVIQNLDLGNIGAQEAFTQAVLVPLKAVATGLDQPVVILVAALDEAVRRQGTETIVHLLAGVGALPTGIRVISTSRPEGAALRHFEERRVLRLLLNANRDENQADIRCYIRGQLDRSMDLQTRPTEQRDSSLSFSTNALH